MGSDRPTLASQMANRAASETQSTDELAPEEEQRLAEKRKLLHPARAGALDQVRDDPKSLGRDLMSMLSSLEAMRAAVRNQTFQDVLRLADEMEGTIWAMEKKELALRQYARLALNRSYLAAKAKKQRASPTQRRVHAAATRLLNGGVPPLGLVTRIHELTGISKTHVRNVLKGLGVLPARNYPR